MKLQKNKYKTPMDIILDLVNEVETSPQEWDKRLGSCDVAQNSRKYFIAIDVPGLTKDEVELRVTERNITIKGERKQSRLPADVEFIQNERSYRRFARSMVILDDMDTSKVDANVKDGVLSIIIPKKSRDEKKFTVEIK